jgi:hypothetical protein
LLLAPGELAGKVGRAVREPDAVEQLTRPGGGPVPALAGDQARQQHVLLRRQGGQQVEELEHEADPVPAHRRQPAVSEPVVPGTAELDLPRRRGLERPEEMQQGALARA